MTDPLPEGPLAPGRTFGRYELIDFLGEGGHGQVWEAKDKETDRRLALKVLTAVQAESPEALQRFHREGRLAASLSHPACVYVIGAEEIEGRPVIAMELMRGGTLRDRLNDGALTVAEAVDYALDLIEGLEAAQEKGIIHRDVKPSNCFLDASGGVAKIGDFGVSRTLEAPSDLSVTGMFIGTPYYASPEQVVGERLTSSSDLYSLGALLYELLTGRVPFEGNPLSVAGKILTETPRPPSDLDSEVPGGLDRIVLKLLEKKSEHRYSDYASVRSALMPFSSRGLITARLGRRTFAYLVDTLPLSLVSVVQAGQLWLLWAVVTFGYFLVAEGVWGRGIGKWLMGLRVTDVNGSELRWRAHAVRAAVWTIFSFAGYATVEILADLGSPVGALSSVLVPGTALLVFATMRRNNGFAGVHEIASGSRVMAELKPHRVAVADRPPHTVAAISEPVTYGPFRATGIVWQSEDERLLTARDDLLDREVWVHVYADEESAPSLDYLSAGRVGQLRWIQGERGQPCWDAYGAPGGSSLQEWSVDEGPRHWESVRSILLDVATELEARSESPSGIQLSANNVWIDSDGRARLLDFPIDGGEEHASRRTVAPELPEWKALLTDVMYLGLLGEENRSMTTGGTALRGPGTPLPGHARQLAQGLQSVSASPRSLPDATEELARVQEKPARIKRSSRLAILGIMQAPAAILGTMLTVAGLLYPVYPEATESFFEVQYKELVDGAATQGASAAADASDLILANLYRNFYDSGRSTSWSIVDPGVRLTMEEASSRHPEISAQQLGDARATLGHPMALQFLQGWSLDSLDEDPELSTDVALSQARDEVGHPLLAVAVLLLITAGIAGITLLILSILAPLSSLVVRGGPLHRLVGIEIQDRFGLRATRLRVLGRAVIAWSPVFLAIVFALVIGVSESTGVFVVCALGLLGMLVLMLVGAIYQVVRPTRGFQDHLAGTFLVPR